MNIISLSLGFEKYHEELAKAIRHASDDNTFLVFAAASNRAISAPTLAFPARHDDAICINSTQADGTTSHFNTQPTRSKDYFTTLGEDVLTAWPSSFTDDTAMQKTQRPDDSVVSTTRLTGTSIATPIAAATACLFLHFVRQSMHCEDLSRGTTQRLPRAAELMKRHVGMRLVLRSVTRRKGTENNAYLYVAPWHLLDAESDKIAWVRESACKTIFEALKLEFVV